MDWILHIPKLRSDHVDVQATANYWDFCLWCRVCGTETRSGDIVRYSIQAINDGHTIFRTFLCLWRQHVHDTQYPKTRVDFEEKVKPDLLPCCRRVCGNEQMSHRQHWYKQNPADLGTKIVPGGGFRQWTNVSQATLIQTKSSRFGYQDCSRRRQVKPPRWKTFIWYMWLWMSGWLPCASVRWVYVGSPAEEKANTVNQLPTNDLSMLDQWCLVQGELKRIWRCRAIARHFCQVSDKTHADVDVNAHCIIILVWCTYSSLFWPTHEKFPPVYTTSGCKEQHLRVTWICRKSKDIYHSPWPGRR